MRSAALKSTPHFALLLLIVVGMVVFDQAIKFSIAREVRMHGTIEITSWLNLVNVLNPGAAFSFLANAGGWQRHFLTVLGLAVSLVLLFWLWRGVTNTLESVGYLGLVGGALGNVVDRVRMGAVVDYLDLHWNDWHWPAFNLADVFVVCGATLLILACFARPSAPPSRA